MTITMPTDKCRMCGGIISEQPILCYENMPKSAQKFPSANEVDNEHGVNLDIFQCVYCGLIQIATEPVPYYRDVIRATAVSTEMRSFRERQFKLFVEAYELTGKKIIEIGAGNGEYMGIMRTAGAVVFGLEHQAQLESAKIFQGFIDCENYAIPESPYDAFYCMNFLEHIPNPSVFLRGIRHNLSAGAVGIVEVPNVDMILKNALFSEFIQDHLMYFTRKTLTHLLESNGFEVINCEPIWHDYIISATVRKRQQVDVQIFQRQRGLITASIAGYIAGKRLEGKSVAVWGAGHQALAILALTGIASEITCVADSAGFKQGKLTPGTHIPVVDPQRLKDFKIGAVLIMAAAYSDEIAEIMRRDYSDIDCAILRETNIEIVT